MRSPFCPTPGLRNAAPPKSHTRTAGGLSARSGAQTAARAANRTTPAMIVLMGDSAASRSRHSRFSGDSQELPGKSIRLLLERESPDLEIGGAAVNVREAASYEHFRQGFLRESGFVRKEIVPAFLDLRAQAVHHIEDRDVPERGLIQHIVDVDLFLDRDRSEAHTSELQ